MKLSSEIGTCDNVAELPATIPTYAHYLRAGGYRGDTSYDEWAFKFLPLADNG